MFEYPDVEERRKALAAMAGIEHHIWIRVGDNERIFAIANEDLERSTEEKTSAVHFLRFELDNASIAAAKAEPWSPGRGAVKGVPRAACPPVCIGEQTQT